MKVNKTEPPLCDTETDKEPINEREFNFKSTIYDRELYLSLSDKSAEIQNKPEEDILEVTEVKPDNNDRKRQFTLPDNAKAGFPLKGRPPSVPRGLAPRGAPPPPGGGCSNPHFRSFKRRF